MRLSRRWLGIILAGVLVALAAAAPTRAQVCGDGTIDAGETCDPPNLAPGPNGQTLCRTDCTSCGDGVVDGGDQETCDVGSLGTACGGCLSNCNEPAFGTTHCPCAFDDPSLEPLRDEIVAACQCTSAASHGAFLRCARDYLKQVSDFRLLTFCRRTALKCLARSVCGKAGAVTCCQTNAHGLRRCTVKPDAAHCTAPAGGVASLGASETCCDACP